MELLSLFAKIGIDDKEYNKGIKGAESKAGKLAKGMKTAFKVGAAAVGVTTAAVAGLSKAIYNNAKETAEYGDVIDKQSQRVGLSAEAYQKWDYVLKIAGTEMSNMRIGLKTMTNQLDKAKKGGQEAQQNFAKLGISLEQLNSMSREEAFGAVIKGFQGMADSTERAALANKMFGRSGQELTPLFNQTAESTDELIKKAEDYGMIMSNDAVKASAEFQDSLTTLSQTAKGLKNRLTGELLPSITKITDGLALLFTRNGKDKGLKEFTKGLSETIDDVTKAIPKIIDIGIPIVEAIADGIIKNLPKLVGSAVQIVTSLGSYVIKEAPNLLKTGLSILLSVTKGITNSLPELIPAVEQIIFEIITILTNPELLTSIAVASVSLLEAFSNALLSPESLKALDKALPEIIANIIKIFKILAPRMVRPGENLILYLLKGMLSRNKLVNETIDSILKRIITKIKGLVDKARHWGRDMISNFIDGISEKIRALRDKVTSVAKTISDRLHFSLPETGYLADADKWMPDFMDLLASGIDTNKFKVSNAIDNLAGDMVLGGGYDDFGGYESVNDTLRLELTVAEGNAPLLQMARLLFPFMQIVSKEKGAF